MPRGVLVNGYRLYLRLGDRVSHRDYREWGEGEVVEEMTSTIQGGTCLVRIQFQDGRQRTFGNDLDAETCCYYFGIRKFFREEAIFERRPARRSRPRALPLRQR